MLTTDLMCILPMHVLTTVRMLCQTICNCRATSCNKVNGYKKRKDRVPFDATEMMKKIQEPLDSLKVPRWCFHTLIALIAGFFVLCDVPCCKAARHYKPPGREIDVEAQKAFCVKSP